MSVECEEITMDPPADPPCPPRWALFVLAVLLFATYLGVQVLFALGVLGWMIATKQPVTPESLTFSDLGTWLSLIAGATGAVVTIGLALIWTLGWSLATSADDGGLAGWLGWQKPIRFSLWLVPPTTLPLLIVVAVGVTWLFGPAEVSTQLQLFSNRDLQIAASIVVTTVVPLAEEFIFRGALYGALLLPEKKGVPEWQRQILPLVVTSILFALVHLIAGFQTVAAIAQVAILSFYLGGLRAISGSVKASLVGHVTWNLISALALILATNLTG